METRYRGTAIVMTDKGILLGKETTDGRYSLIGGQCNYVNGKRESRENAAIRELNEETGLEAVLTKELGEVITLNGNIQTNHKLYLIKAKGKLKMTSKYTAKSNTTELFNLGFFNINYLNQPDTAKYQGHVYACLKNYINECNNGLDWKNFKSNINFN
ncbi:MAG: NUDIX domain-containing protein [Candidatus Nanoarchaeia archaeon]|nr:NUDIX domain-containing protein [Candidatus Nanoarchaeia archaeon]